MLFCADADVCVSANRSSCRFRNRYLLAEQEKVLLTRRCAQHPEYSVQKIHFCVLQVKGAVPNCFLGLVKSSVRVKLMTVHLVSKSDLGCGLQDLSLQILRPYLWRIRNCAGLDTAGRLRAVAEKEWPEGLFATQRKSTVAGSPRNLQARTSD